MEYREKWKTEKEIGDEFIKYMKSIQFDDDSVYFKRESPVGRGFADFIFYSKNEIIVCELKITATMNSIKQLVTYRDVVSFSLFQFCNKNGIDHTKIKISSYLVARYFDTDVVDFAELSGIDCMRFSLEKNGDSEFDFISNYSSMIPCNCSHHETFFESNFNRIFGDQNA